MGNGISITKMRNRSEIQSLLPILPRAAEATPGEVLQFIEGNDLSLLFPPHALCYFCVTSGLDFTGTPNPDLDSIIDGLRAKHCAERRDRR
jgi:hypothetical protein